jgi:hydrogenase/urease accessory protein HupE
VAWSYLVHGLHHILTGYDHLLFVAALVLAASRLWDLVKVVTAFALAHTLTLTLSVLNIVRLPSSIVEPVITGSIVFVALQNALFPRQAQGSARLVIAFVFGLFHGLGFAGGLLETMEGMPAINLLVALVAFTLGVEIAHQLLIVPLYFVLRLLRRRNSRDGTALNPAVEPSMQAPALSWGFRLASVGISLIGMGYFVASLLET